MRLSIRTQLGVLFMLSGLVAIAVISIACWITVHNFVLNLRGQRLAQIATLKAAQLSLSLHMMDNTVKALTSRDWLRNALLQRSAGTITAQTLNSTDQNLQSSLVGLQQETLALQAALWPTTGQPNVTNQPNMSFNDLSALPEEAAPRSALWFGGSDLSQYPTLYPNLTYANGPGNTSIASFNSRTLDVQSSVLLGPLQLNDTFVLFSITRAVTDQTNTQVLGWLTVILDGRLILEISQDSTALGNTGLNLIVGPNTLDNRFVNVSATQPYWDQASKIHDQRVHFALPPARGATSSTDVERPQARTNSTAPWQLSTYPAADMAYTANQKSRENAGSHLQDRNEYGTSVGVGFATPQTDLCDWVYMVELTSKEVYTPIAQVRTVILICVFSTLAALILVVVPVTGVWAHPVRRLRASTAESIAVYNDSESILGKALEPKADGSPDAHGHQDVEDNDQSWKKDLFPLGEKEHTIRRLPANKRKDIHKLTGAKSQFRVPPRVKERRTFAFIKDELSELTRVFNEMIDELTLQYTRLEERVKERTAELEQSKKAAEAANESKSLFIANISHELKTPLNGILGMTAVCMQEENPARIRESLNIIYRSGDLLHNLLTDLLTFSKNQAGKALALEEKRFRLRDVATQIRSIFDHQARSSDVTLLMQFEDPSEHLESQGKLSFRENPDHLRNILLMGDQNRILQVVINLVGNALKFTPTKGTVWLRLRQLNELASSAHEFKDPWDSGAHEANGTGAGGLANGQNLKLLESGSNTKSSVDISPEEGPVSTDGHVDDDNHATDAESALPSCWFEFEIEDTGPGIEKEIQDKIFEPFVQGDVGLARKHGGTGLGLSICSQIAKLMHGSISVESEPGKGSTFCLRIPLKVLGHVESTPQSSANSSAVSLPKPVAQDSAPTEAEVETRTSVLEPTPRSASIVSQLAKPRLLGFSQPFFSASTPPLASPSSESPPSALKPKQTMRVLVAEDNDTNRKVVVRLLELEEVVNVVVARDGEEAFERVKESLDSQIPFDLVLMDVQMPRLDGRQSTKLIRQAGFTAPIVALTAFTDEMNEKECIESGMDYFIGKPIRKAELKKILRRFSLDKDVSGISEHSSAAPSTASPRKVSTATLGSNQRPSI